MKENMRFITIAPYNPDWPQLFLEEAARIKEALGQNRVGQGARHIR